MDAFSSQASSLQELVTQYRDKLAASYFIMGASLWNIGDAVGVYIFNKSDLFDLTYDLFLSTVGFCIGTYTFRKAGGIYKLWENACDEMVSQSFSRSNDSIVIDVPFQEAK